MTTNHPTRGRDASQTSLGDILDGRVLPFYDQEAGVIYVSMTEGRAKTANLRRDPRATLEVTSPDGWAWATAEGMASLTGPGTVLMTTTVDHVYGAMLVSAYTEHDYQT